MHTDGDGAVRAGLDGVAALRKALPAADIRPAIAHDEIVAPADFKRYKTLNVIPVLSFQWEKPAGDTLGVKDYFGPERMKILEPAGFLAEAGARIAFGSDWPVDALDQWFAFKVGVTRTNAPEAPAEYRGRLGDDPGLSRETVLRAPRSTQPMSCIRICDRLPRSRQAGRSHRAGSQSADGTG